MITLLLSSKKHRVDNCKTLLPFKSCADCVLHYQRICRWCLSTRNETKLWFEHVGTSLEYVREIHVVLNILPWKTFNVGRYNCITIPGFYWFSRTLSSNLIKNFLWNQPHKLNIWKTFDVNTSRYGNPYDPREGHQSTVVPDKSVNCGLEQPTKHVILTEVPVWVSWLLTTHQQRSLRNYHLVECDQDKFHNNKPFFNLEFKNNSKRNANISKKINKKNKVWSNKIST